VLNPVILGKGQPLFGAKPEHLDLDLVEAKSFKNRSVLLRYRPV
jgi:dihydrofolate reductase